MKTKLNDQDIDLAYNLLSSGLSQTIIASYFDVSTATLRKHIVTNFGGLPEVDLHAFVVRFMQVSTPTKTAPPTAESDEGSYFCKTPDNRVYKCYYDNYGVYNVTSVFSAPKGVEVREVEERPAADHIRDQDTSPE
jgi:hypothetical protein